MDESSDAGTVCPFKDNIVWSIFCLRTFIQGRLNVRLWRTHDKREKEFDRAGPYADATASNYRGCHRSLSDIARMHHSTRLLHVGCPFAPTAQPVASIGRGERLELKTWIRSSSCGGKREQTARPSDGHDGFG